MDHNSLDEFSARPQVILSMDLISNADFWTYDIFHNCLLYDMYLNLSLTTNMIVQKCSYRVEFVWHSCTEPCSHGHSKQYSIVEP
ncbi:unnamed protein product [Schistosoma bovis]|nr:unnamed protein product [Schistosoma bovis]